MASEQAEAIKAALIEYRKEMEAPPASHPGADAGQLGPLRRHDRGPEGVTWTPVDAGGVPAIWAIRLERPAGPRVRRGPDDRALQYVHGGGYVLGSAEAYQHLTGHLANAIGCRVLNVDYGLAPEHPHPGPVEDSVTAYRWLLDQGFAPSTWPSPAIRRAAGSLWPPCSSCETDGLPQPAAAVPLSPWTDMEGLGETMETHADRDVLVQRGSAKRDDRHVPGRRRSPGPVRGSRPRRLHAASARSTSRSAGMRSCSTTPGGWRPGPGPHGVDVQLDEFPEMQHVFQMAAGNMPEADEAVARIGAYLRPRLGLA